jgi:hypothetical protein
MKRAGKINEIGNAFNPNPLKYEELDELYYDEAIEFRTGVKYDSPIQDIFEACREHSENNAFLLMGHRGCGKSTELIKMSSDLNDLGYQVSVIHCDADIDLFNPSFSDLLILMCDALINIVSHTGCILEEKLIENISSYWTTDVETVSYIDKTQGAAFEAGVGAKSPALLTLINTFINVKADLRVNENKRTTYRTRISNSTREWLEMLGQITNAISSNNNDRKPILIFLDLDKINDLDKAFAMFSNHAAALTGVTFPVVYTCPIALSYYPRFASLIGRYDAKTALGWRAHNHVVVFDNTVKMVVRRRLFPLLFNVPCVFVHCHGIAFHLVTVS